MTGVPVRADGPTFELDIPAGTADVALKALAEQTEFLTLFQSDDVEQVRTQAIKGPFTVEEALVRILADTPLAFDLIKRGVIVVRHNNLLASISSEKSLTGNETMQNNQSLFKRVAGLLAAAMLAPATGAAETEASEAKTDSKFIEEIIVTARRTSENLQRVPIVVTALDPTDLEQHNIVNRRDLMYAVPSLTIAADLNSFISRTSLRGLPVGATSYLAESPCCSGGANMPFMDIASVQVLNGPQGTLFGRSSAAGSVLVEPVRPDLNETDARVKFRIGDYGRAEFTGAVSVPIIKDRLAVRLAANVQRVDGYTDQIGSNVKLDDRKSEQFRLGVQYEGERFSNYTAISHQNIDQSAGNLVLVQSDLNVFPFNFPVAFWHFFGLNACPNAVALGLNPDIGSCAAERQSIINNIAAELTTEQARIDAGGDSAKRLSPGPVPGLPQFNKLESWSILNRAEFGAIELGNVDISFKDVFSHSWSVDNTSNHADGLGGVLQESATAPINFNGASNNNVRNGVLDPQFADYDKTLNNDLNVLFDVADGLVDGVLGYYYRRRETPSGNGIAIIYKVYGGTLEPDLGYSRFGRFHAGSKSTEHAWYTQATLDLSRLDVPGLSFTAGYRKTRNESTSGSLPVDRDPVDGSYIPRPGGAVRTTQAKSDGYNYLFTLTEQFTDEFMMYLSHSRAYVPGGRNTGVVPADAVPANYSETFGPQIVKSWELGAKIDFVLGDDVPVRLNGALYHYAFDDIQRGIRGATEGGIIVAYTANAAGAELQGFELSGGILPTDNLEISFAYNYNDAKYTEWFAADPLFLANVGNPACSPNAPAGFCLLDLSNQSFERMPEHQGHVKAAYTLPISPDLGNLVLSATLYAQSMVWFSSNPERELDVVPNSKESISQDGYSRLNLRADWDNIFGSSFDAAIFVSNATDKLYKIVGISQLFTAGVSTAHYAAPRMIGLEISRQF